jgi:hypothetical protein
MFTVQRLSGPKVHRDPMLDDTVALKNFIQYLKSSATLNHIVFGDDLKPVHDRLFREDVSVMRYPQAYAYAIVGVPIEPVCRHVRLLIKIGSYLSGGLMTQASRSGRLGFGWLGAVGRTAAFTFAIVLPRMLAAAFSLAVILPFAGVLRQSCFVLSNEQDTGNRRLGGGRIVGVRSWLSMKANSRTAQKTGERCSQSE